MSKTESKSRIGGDLSPVEQVKQAVVDFIRELKSFQSEVQAKHQQTEERLTMLDRKSQIAARPHLAQGEPTEAPHQRAFGAYLRSGDDDGLRGLELEGKSLSTAVNSDGGYLVDPQTSEAVASVLHSTASIRAVASVVNVEATSYDVLIDTTDVGAGWATEATAIGETDTPQIERITIPLHELSALPKASQRLLDDSAFDIESWLAGRIADKFSRAEAVAFVNGDGVDKPKGFLAHPAVEQELWQWGSLGFVSTGAAGNIGNGDGVIALVYALGAEYRANGSFVMNSKTAGQVRILKGSDGRHLWADGLASGEPARLLGYPVLVAEDMPDVAPDSFAIAFGDFGAGYTVAERPDLRVLRDPFSATKRVGGDVSDFAAIKLLKFGVT